MAEYGVDIQKTLLAVLLGVILTAAVILALVVVYLRYEIARETSEEFTQPPARLEALLAEQQTRLTDYRVLDKEKGVVAIPITHAMELVVAELSASQAGDAASPGTPVEENPQ